MPRGYGGDEYSDEDVRRLRKALGARGGAATSSGLHGAPHRDTAGRRTGYSDDGLGEAEQPLSDTPEHGAR